MVRGREWTGFEAAALQEAMRKSVREFAALLGVEATTITNWRSGLGSVTPRSGTQAILDTAYQQRATAEDRERFAQIVSEGEAVWKIRHPRPGSHAAEVGIVAVESRAVPMANTVESQPPSVNDPGTSEQLLDVLGRVERLSRHLDPSIVNQLKDSTCRTIAQYETLDPTALVPAVRKQRAWLDRLIEKSNHPAERRRLFQIASETSGLLGYISVGQANFSLARAYCLESFHLGEYAADSNLMAWARGIHSFCEYYAGQYDTAVRLAEDGLVHAGGGPQSVRLAINGVARAKGKLGDVEGVHRAVDHASDILSDQAAPAGVPSSISLGSYSAAQVAGNAATAYLSLAMPDEVETHANRALAEMSEANSPWGRSLVMIDVARSHILSDDADLDAAAAVMLEALDPARSAPMVQVRRRGMELVQDATARWGDVPVLRDIRDMLTEVGSAGEHHG